jgi:hypothetical protein
MIWNKIIMIIAAMALTVLLSCSKVTGDLADQYPSLVVEITNTSGSTIGPYVAGTSYPVYLVFFSNSNWTNPWFTLKSTTDSFYLYKVPSLSFYVMAFIDSNNNGVVDAGEPCTGYDNINHLAASPANELTKLELFPLQLGKINITISTFVY